MASNPDKKWGAFTFDHLYEDESRNGTVSRMITPDPRPGSPQRGVPGTSSFAGPMGCPSVSFFPNDWNFFDENLIVVNDHDMHHRLLERYGEALIIPILSVRIRQHPGQATHFTREREGIEWEYFRIKAKLMWKS